MSGTVIIQCPIPVLLQAFYRKNGTIVWRSPLSAQTCENEKWFCVKNGILEPLENVPNDLCDLCNVSYIAPTIVQYKGEKHLTALIRYTIVDVNGDCLGVLFINEKTGSFDSVDPALVETKMSEKPTIVVCEQKSEKALLVQECSPKLIRWNHWQNVTTGQIVAQEVWGICSCFKKENRLVKYFEFGTEKELDDLVMNGHEWKLLSL